MDESTRKGITLKLIPGEAKRRVKLIINETEILTDYEVTTLGRVVTHKSNPPGFMNLTINKDGYAVVDIRSPLLENGKKQYGVHQLVAQAFIDNPESLPIVHHKNSDKGDNRVENLMWVTHQENIDLAAWLEERKIPITVQNLYRLVQQKVVNKRRIEELAIMFNVKPNMVKKILNGEVMGYCLKRILSGKYDREIMGEDCSIEDESVVLSAEYCKSVEIK